MRKLTMLSITGASLVVLLSASALRAETQSTQTKKTVTEETVITTSTVPNKPRRRAKAPPPPMTVVTIVEGEDRQVLDEKTLKKMADKLCSDGFKPYVGNDHKNVCQGKADSPDIAYSCVWRADGTAVFPDNKQGPCTLDYTEADGSIVVTKNEWQSNPPLSYGTEAYCCSRDAKGPTTTKVETIPAPTGVK